MANGFSSFSARHAYEFSPVTTLCAAIANAICAAIVTNAICGASFPNAAFGAGMLFSIYHVIVIAHVSIHDGRVGT